jgi:hypothetical protein
VSRPDLDRIAWASIRSRPIRVIAHDRGARPHNFKEMEDRLQAGQDFEHVWSDFLHAFYDYKSASFFEFPSPASLDEHHQALLAGAAEWLSQKFQLPVPEWTNNPKYFLDEPWDPWEDFGVEITNMDERLAQAPEAFRKRNVVFESRDLIAL